MPEDAVKERLHIITRFLDKLKAACIIADIDDYTTIRDIEEIQIKILKWADAHGKHATSDHFDIITSWAAMQCFICISQASFHNPFNTRAAAIGL